jgi:uncharacterized protein (DUF924 family)
MSTLAAVSLVLSFWFGNQGDPDYGQPKPFWFQSNPALDQSIRDQFETLYQDAVKGKLEGFMDTPEGSLALVIILDQFPRNMYRGTPQAYLADPLALKVAKATIAKGFDQKLLPQQRAFLYLPFQHSESLEDQEKSVELFTSLESENNLQYAVGHRDIIARFGRFPHRNNILGRESTPEEISFLEEPGSSF